MSSLRPNSVCDTTPLQRFESQSSSSEPSSPAFNGHCLEENGAEISATAVATADDLTKVIIGKNSETIVGGQVAPTAATVHTTLVNHLHHHHHHNNNNINKIEVGINKNYTSDSKKRRKMDYERSRRQIFPRILGDLCILLCVVLPIYGLQYWGVPHARGFFCADETIKLPYQESTLKTWHMTLMCLIVPVSLITLVEFYRAHGYSENDDFVLEIFANDDYFICQLPLPDWLITCYKKIGFLIFGAGVAKLTTDIAKYSIGRLRPYFYTVCQPVMHDGTTCSDPINSDRYIEDFLCQGEEATLKTIREMQLSFPSGHTNLAFFTMVYMNIYLQKRMTWQGSKMLKHLLQFLLLMFAWYTALTRVSDYRHHYTDVMAGAAIGTTYAIVVTSSMW